MANANSSINWDNIYKFAAFIILIAPSSIILSYIYNFGYFYQFDIGLYQIPISWNDFVLTSIIWLPLFIILIFSYILIEFHFKRVEGFQSEVEITKVSPKIKKFRDSEKYLLPLGLGILLVDYLARGHTYTYHFTCIFTFLFILFNLWLANHKNYSSRTNLTTRVFIFAFTVTVAFFFNIGRDNAHNDYYNSKLSINLPNEENNTILRAFEKFILIKNSNGYLQLEPFNYAYTIKSNTLYSPYKGFMESLMLRFCKK